jgi:hypothetical protein
MFYWDARWVKIRGCNGRKLSCIILFYRDVFKAAFCKCRDERWVRYGRVTPCRAQVQRQNNIVPPPRFCKCRDERWVRYGRLGREQVQNSTENKSHLQRVSRPGAKFN